MESYTEIPSLPGLDARLVYPDYASGGDEQFPHFGIELKSDESPDGSINGSTVASLLTGEWQSRLAVLLRQHGFVSFDVGGNIDPLHTIADSGFGWNNFPRMGNGAAHWHNDGGPNAVIALWNAGGVEDPTAANTGIVTRAELLRALRTAFSLDSSMPSGTAHRCALFAKSCDHIIRCIDTLLATGPYAPGARESVNSDVLGRMISTSIVLPIDTVLENTRSSLHHNCAIHEEVWTPGRMTVFDDGLLLHARLNNPGTDRGAAGILQRLILHDVLR